MNELDNLKANTAAELTETYSCFKDYKETFDTVLKRTADDFVKIGYLLKYARDTEILAESGYDSLTDFAKAEYGLDKTQVSRFISINDRFSKGGYGSTLEDKYEGFGYAKLSIMLTLPEEITEELTPDMTKSEINDIKKEIDTELQKSDMEVILEENAERPSDEATEVSLVIREFVKANPRLYGKLHKVFVSGDAVQLINVLAPNGKDIYFARVPGLGKYSVIAEDGLTIISLRTNEKSSVCWKEAENELAKWFYVDRSAAESWKALTFSELPGEETTKTDIKPQKTAENDEKQQKTEEKQKKTAVSESKTVKTEPKPKEKKPSRIHKPEQVEKKTEEPAPQEEVKTSGQSEGIPVDPEEKFFSNSEPAARFMPEPVEEIEPGTLGHLEVVKDEVAPVQQDRIIEVREEIDLERFKIDASADIKTQIQQVDLAIRLRLRHMEVSASCVNDFFELHPSESIMFSGNVPATRKDWITSFASNARGIEEAAHDVELLNDYLRELELREDEE